MSLVELASHLNLGLLRCPEPLLAKQFTFDGFPSLLIICSPDDVGPSDFINEVCYQPLTIKLTLTVTLKPTLAVEAPPA